jgi:hypothetical protein
MLLSQRGRRLRRPSGLNSPVHVDSDTVTSRGTPTPAFAVELYRSRRHGRNLAVVGIPSDADLRAVHHELRIVDQLLIQDEQAFLILSESDRAGARALLARLQRCGAVPDALTRSRVAIFPEDALTCETLLAKSRVQVRADLSPGSEKTGAADPIAMTE